MKIYINQTFYQQKPGQVFYRAVDGRPVFLPGWPGRYAITPDLYDEDRVVVTNIETGMALKSGDTAEEAIANTLAGLRERGTPAGLWEQIIDEMLVHGRIAPAPEGEPA